MLHYTPFLLRAQVRRTFGHSWLIQRDAEREVSPRSIWHCGGSNKGFARNGAGSREPLYRSVPSIKNLKQSIACIGRIQTARHRNGRVLCHRFLLWPASRPATNPGCRFAGAWTVASAESIARVKPICETTQSHAVEGQYGGRRACNNRRTQIFRVLGCLARIASSYSPAICLPPFRSRNEGKGVRVKPLA